MGDVSPGEFLVRVSRSKAIHHDREMRVIARRMRVRVLNYNQLYAYNMAGVDKQRQMRAWMHSADLRSWC